MLAFTGEPSSLWQAAAAARRVSGLWSALAEAEQERDDAADALAACQAQAAGTIAQLRDKLDALTAHMNQVHETLGGSDTVLTLEAAQHVVAKLADAERERDRKASWVEEQADIISRGRAENAQLRVKLAEAEKDRGDANDALAACQAQAAGTIARLREALDKWEDSALNLLAVVHRDGGQHTATVGFSASCTEAEAVVVALRAKLAEAERERDETVAGAEYRRKLLAALEARCAAAEAELDAAEKLTYWFLKKYPATWARAKRTLFADTARTAATTKETSHE
jgi:chromosome segregation ATPase